MILQSDIMILLLKVNVITTPVTYPVFFIKQMQNEKKFYFLPKNLFFQSNNPDLRLERPLCGVGKSGTGCLYQTGKKYHRIKMKGCRTPDRCRSPSVFKSDEPYFPFGRTSMIWSTKIPFSFLESLTYAGPVILRCTQPVTKFAFLIPSAIR